MSYVSENSIMRELHCAREQALKVYNYLETCCEDCCEANIRKYIDPLIMLTGDIEDTYQKYMYNKTIHPPTCKELTYTFADGKRVKVTVEIQENRRNLNEV